MVLSALTDQELVRRFMDSDNPVISLLARRLSRHTGNQQDYHPRDMLDRQAEYEKESGQGRLFE